MPSRPSRRLVEQLALFQGELGVLSRRVAHLPQCAVGVVSEIQKWSCLRVSSEFAVTVLQHQLANAVYCVCEAQQIGSGLVPKVPYLD